MNLAIDTNDLFIFSIPTAGRSYGYYVYNIKNTYIRFTRRIKNTIALKSKIQYNLLMLGLVMVICEHTYTASH